MKLSMDVIKHTNYKNKFSGFINKKLNNDMCLNMNNSLNFKGSDIKSMQIAAMEVQNTRFDKTFYKIIDDFKQLPQVSAITIGGSRKTNKSDKLSDIDIEIYTEGEISKEDRLSIIKKYSTKYDVGQDYFGPCDEFYVNNLAQFDIAYFDKNWMDSVVDDVWRKHKASNGYTTCFLHTLKNCEPLYDRDGWLQAKKEELNTPYPKELRNNIVERNMQLLKDKPFDSYYEQIKKAHTRKDYNSLNHRIAAFLASYFDVIFAMNEVFHPGEKRLVQFAKDKCKILPDNFEENITRLTLSPASDTMTVLDDMINELKKCIDRQN